MFCYDAVLESYHCTEQSRACDEDEMKSIKSIFVQYVALVKMK